MVVPRAVQGPLRAGYPQPPRCGAEAVLHCLWADFGSLVSAGSGWWVIGRGERETRVGLVGWT